MANNLFSDAQNILQVTCVCVRERERERESVMCVGLIISHVAPCHCTMEEIPINHLLVVNGWLLSSLHFSFPYGWVAKWLKLLASEVKTWDSIPATTWLDIIFLLSLPYRR